MGTLILMQAFCKAGMDQLQFSDPAAIKLAAAGLQCAIEESLASMDRKIAVVFRT